MDTSEYYVTAEGLAAAIVNPEIHRTLRGILTGKAHPQTVKAIERRKLIAKEQRQGARTDHNTLITTGALDRIREIMQPVPGPVAEEVPAPKPAPKAAAGPTRYEAVQPQGPQLSPTLSTIYETVKSIGTASVEELKRANPVIAAMNPGTLRWAIQPLRKKGLLQSKRLEEVGSAA